MVLMTVLVHRLHREQPLAAMLVTAVCGLLVSPVTWTHHWVWVVPLTILLGYHAVKHVTARVLLVVVLVVFSVDFRLLVRSGNRLELSWTVGETLIGNSYLWAALLVTGVCVAMTARRRQEFAAAGITVSTGLIPNPRPRDRSGPPLVDQRRR
jgi:alpha-1,2-mannosyltransferase